MAMVEKRMHRACVSDEAEDGVANMALKSMLSLSKTCRVLAMTITHFPPAERKRNLDLDLFPQRMLCLLQLLSAWVPRGRRERRRNGGMDVNPLYGP
ncbi:hypothetical protein SRHO_G00245710 [Serrasalmus rhombeus]